MLVYELNLAIAAQKHAKIIEPGDIALKLHSIDEIDCHRSLALANSVQERVLEVLRFIVHG